MYKTFTAVFLSLAACAAQAQVDITGAWVRATVQGQKATGAFMSLTAKKTTRLVGIKTDAAAVAEVHEMSMDKDVMRMRAIPALDLPAGKTVTLKPGGYHVMPVDSHVQLTLLFEDAAGVKSQQELHLMTTAKAPGADNKPADAHHKH